MGVLIPKIPTVPEPWRSALVLAGFAALLAVVGPRHEPWFDEAQAWLIGRDATLWDMLAHRVRYEGTPGLWHLVLWLAAHAGLPFSGLWLVSGACACIGAWIVLTRAPFPYWLRVATVFSYFVAYQYAIVARSYALDLALIPALAATFTARLRHPILYGALLGLTANTNAHSFLIAGVLAAEFALALCRRAGWRPWTLPRAQLAGGAIYALLALAAVLQAWPPADASYLSTLERASGRGAQMMIEAFVDRLDIWSATQPAEWSQRVGVVITAALLAPSLVLFQRARVAWLALALFAALIGFSIINFATYWHAGLLFLCWVFALWIAWGALASLGPARRRVTLAAVATVMLVNVGYTAAAAVREVREAYSAAPAAAQAVRGDGARVAAIGFKTFAIQPWFATNVFRNYHDGAPAEAFYSWKLGEAFLPYVSYDQWRETAADSRYNLLLLSTHKIPAEYTAAFVAAARQAGYCEPTEIGGGLIWKSYVMESDVMLVFRRCADTLAARAEPAAP